MISMKTLMRYLPFAMMVYGAIVMLSVILMAVFQIWGGYLPSFVWDILFPLGNFFGVPRPDDNFAPIIARLLNFMWGAVFFVIGFVYNKKRSHS